ncbi:MAG: hypothetical protein ABIP13_03565 [Tepidiformaceae bacterium]
MRAEPPVGRIQSRLATEAGAEHHEVRPLGGERLVAEPEAIEHSGNKAFDEHVGPGDHPFGELATFGEGQIEGQAPFGTVEVGEELRAVQPGFAVLKRGAKTEHIRARGAFDVDHGCAVVGEGFGDDRADAHPREIRHLKALEGAAARRGRDGGNLGSNSRLAQQVLVLSQRGRGLDHSNRRAAEEYGRARMLAPADVLPIVPFLELRCGKQFRDGAHRRDEHFVLDRAAHEFFVCVVGKVTRDLLARFRERCRRDCTGRDGVGPIGPSVARVFG